MADLLYSLERVFTSYPNGKTYNIPEYQRGYKWTNQQVEQLLEDIYKFSLTRDEDHFYCLQNITLFQNKTIENFINVVDGQQRLTTVTLLLAYLNQNGILKNKLYYAVRKPSNEFIQEIIDNESNLISAIIESENFENFIASQTSDRDYQDIYHMYSSIRTIDSWFKLKENVDCLAFAKIILNHVKLIVNKVEHVSEQELFMNLNAGKVHLDGSDLIRAILITRVAKQELEYDDHNDIQNILKLNQRRTRIGWELDEMNNWWSKENVKSYFQNFTNIQTSKKETIKFDQEIHPINLLYKIWVEIQGEKEIKLVHFEKGKALFVYQSILELHRVLKDWYEDRKIYHYLGFLFALKKIKIKTVFDYWTSSKTTRDNFTNKWCVKQLQKAIFDEKRDEQDEQGLEHWLNKITDYNSENPTNWYEAKIIQEILLLLDVIDHSTIKESGIPLPFLKPKYFKNYKEDKEHIFSGTPNELKEIRSLPNPIEKLNEYIASLNIGYEENQHISLFEYSESDWNSLGDQQQAIVLTEFKHLIHKKRPVNSLGNLVLLHLTINRGFGNSEYVKKRAQVIENTVNGLYVRQHTINAFIKSTSSDNLNNWTLKDVEKNADNINLTIRNFFKSGSNE